MNNCIFSALFFVTCLALLPATGYCQNPQMPQQYPQQMPTQHTPTPKPTPPPSGSIDSKLVGNWVNRFYSSDYSYYLFFKDDGSFSYLTLSGTISTTVKGRYSTSGGKIHLSDCVVDNGQKLKNQSINYSFGSDRDGDYMEVTVIAIIYSDSNEMPSGNTTMRLKRSS